jgi:hypothetical protein
MCLEAIQRLYMYIVRHLMCYYIILYHITSYYVTKYRYIDT